MEIIKESIKMNNYVEYNKLIKNISENLKNNIFEYLIKKVIDKKIGEYEYIKFVDFLINSTFELHKYNEIINKISELKKNNLFNSYKFTLICHIKDKIENNGQNIINNLKKIKNIKYICIKKCTNLRELLNNKRKIDEIIKYLDSYKNKSILFKKNKYDDVTNINNNYDKYTEKEELIKRIIKLVKIFGLEFMENINVPIKSSTDINEYNINQIINYYGLVVKKLIIYFNKLEDILMEYVDISNIYAKIKLMRNMLINVTKYENII